MLRIIYIIINASFFDFYKRNPPESITFPNRVLLLPFKPSAHCATKAKQYAGQIAAYREVLEAGGKEVDSTWIHFPLAVVAVVFDQV